MRSVLGAASLALVTLTLGCTPRTTANTPYNAPPSAAVGPLGATPPPGSWANEAIFQDVVRRVIALRGLSLSRKLVASELDDITFDTAFAAQTKRYLGETDRAPDARQTLGFYDYTTRRVYVRRELPAWTQEHENPRGILAHEVVHALQHEHFPAILEPDPARSSDAQQAVSALVEGDAEITRAVFEAAEASRPPKRAIAARFLGGDGKEDDSVVDNPELAAIPESAREVMYFPYRRGAAFVAEFYVTGGFPLINKLYQAPPTTTASVLHPGLYLYGQKAARIRPIPVPATYDAKGHPGAIGELGMRIVLRELKVPRSDAVAIAQTWRGDYFLDLGKTLFRGPTFAWVIVFDSEKSAERALRLLSAGLSAQQRGRAIVVVAGLSRRDAMSLANEALDLPDLTSAPSTASPTAPLGALSFARVPPTLEATGMIRGEQRGQEWVVPGLGLSFPIPAGMSCQTGGAAGLVAVCNGAGETFLLAFSTGSGSAEGQAGYRIGMTQGYKKDEPQTKSADAGFETPLGPGTALTVSYPHSDSHARFVTVPICRGRALIASFHTAKGTQAPARAAEGAAASVLRAVRPLPGNPSEIDAVERSAVCEQVWTEATVDLPLVAPEATQLGGLEHLEIAVDALEHAVHLFDAPQTPAIRATVARGLLGFPHEIERAFGRRGLVEKDLLRGTVVVAIELGHPLGLLVPDDLAQGARLFPPVGRTIVGRKKDASPVVLQREVLRLGQRSTFGRAILGPVARLSPTARPGDFGRVRPVHVGWSRESEAILVESVFAGREAILEDGADHPLIHGLVGPQCKPQSERQATMPPLALATSPMTTFRPSASSAVVLALLGASAAASLGCSEGTAPTPRPGDRASSLTKSVAGAPRGLHAVSTATTNERVEVYLLLAGNAAADEIPSGAVAGEPLIVERVRRRLGVIATEQAPIVEAVTSAGGVVTATHRRLVNAVQAIVPATSIDALARIPGVIAVDRVPLYERANTSAVPFIGGYAAWSLGDGTIHGKGVRVGVIDTGIDYTHADFGGPGTPEAYTANDSTIVEPGSFPTAKVLGGRDFVGDKYDAAGTTSPKPDADPLDCAGLQQMAISGGHGTHVAGTIAGVGVSALTGKAFDQSYLATLDPRSFRVGPGVAPEASLFALKVFGCTGSTAAVASALEWSSDPNDDGDFSDRLDVLNMSLGGSYGLPTAADQKQIKNLTKLGTFLAVAAGNDGGVFFVTGAPATYSEVLSVAASTDTLSYGTLTVDAPAAVAGDYPASEGSFTKPLAITGNVSGTVVAATPALACSDLTNSAALAGKIALIERGACTFVDKIARAEKAGAIGALVVDSEDSDVPFAMGGSGAEVGIPGMLVRLEDGTKLKAQLGQGLAVTFRSDKDFQVNIGADQIAGFSSRGPRLDDSALKPEISAPGVSVSSAGVATGNGARELQGTSMACPVIAGAAALVRQAYPAYAPVEVKAALMNHTADIGDGTGKIAPVSLQGSGRVRVDRALQGKTTARVVADDGQVGVSFGVLVVAEPTTTTKTVRLTNHGSTAMTYAVSVTPTKELSGTSVTPAQATVEVPANGTADVDLSLLVTPEALPAPAVDAFTAPQSRNGDYRHFLVEADGHVVFTPQGAGEVPPEQIVRLPYYGVVRAAGTRHVAGTAGCGDTFTLPIEGPTAARQSFTSVFELGATYEPGSASIGTIIAIGAATDAATVSDPDTISAYFAIALSKPWSTPAQGPLSLVGVNVDVDGDEEADYITFVEPRRRSGPYGDTIVATTYFAKSGARAGQPRAINMLTRDEGDTQIFHNDVVVLPVTLQSLGLDPGAAKIHYQMFTQSLTAFAQESTDWIAFDLEHPAVDGAKGGIAGQPIYQDAASLSVKLDRSRIQAGAASALVLHHGNVEGQRFDVVSLPLEATEAKLVVTVGDATKDASGGTTVAVSLRNEGASAVTDIALATKVEGATVGTRVGNGASCPDAASSPCTIASLAAGQTVVVSIAVAPSEPSYSVAASATVAKGCFDAGGEESAPPRTFPGQQPTPPTTASQATAAPLGTVGGGYDCSLASAPANGETRTPAAVGLGALALCALLRRTRRPRD